MSETKYDLLEKLIIKINFPEAKNIEQHLPINFEMVLEALNNKLGNISANMAGHVVKVNKNGEIGDLLFCWKGYLAKNLKDQYPIIIDTIYELLI